MAACKLLKTVLITKAYAFVCCNQFNIPQFLTEEEWKTVRKFEAILRETFRLTAACQSEEKLNGAYGPVMRKYLHDNLSRGNMCVINTDLWSSSKEMIHPTRSEVNIASFSETGRICLKKALLERERIFFNNRSE